MSTIERQRDPPIVPDYDMLRCIGRGPDGETWLGRSVLGKLRAVKVVYRDAFESDEPYLRQFVGIREFEPISAHESQVRVYHIGENAQAYYFYYIMDLADDASFSARSTVGSASPTGITTAETGGELSVGGTYVPATLSLRLLEQGRLPARECLSIATCLAAALEHLHEHGLVHRDIKPASIVFVNGQPKLADIGLVANVATAKTFVGTVGYIPPEGPGQPQADIYSFGKVLYQMVTGCELEAFPKLPDDFLTMPDHAVLLGLNEIILQACQNDPARRYASAEELRRSLNALHDGDSLRRPRAHAKGVLVAAGGLAFIGLAAMGISFWQKVPAKHSKNSGTNSAVIAPARATASETSPAPDRSVSTEKPAAAQNIASTPASAPKTSPPQAAPPRGQDFKFEWMPAGAARSYQPFNFYWPTFIKLSPQRPVSIKKLPMDLKAALYGQFSVGPSESPTLTGAVLDEPADGPARLFVDSNGNGDLTDDPPAEWRGSPRTRKDGSQGVGYNGGVTMTIRFGAQPVPLHFILYRFDKDDPARAGQRLNLYYYRDYARTGKISLGGKTYSAWLSDDRNRGDFRLMSNEKSSGVTLCLDVNGNGKVDFDTEKFDLARPFNVGGASYIATIGSAAGEVLHVAPSRQPVPELVPQDKGDKAREFTARVITGSSFSFPSSYKGKLVLLDFWATWCGPCIAEAPNVVAAYEKYAPHGLVILGISLDDTKSPAEVQEFARGLGMKWPLIREGGGWEARLAKLFNVSSIPKSFLVDGNTGTILAVGAELRGASLDSTLARAFKNKN